MKKLNIKKVDITAGADLPEVMQALEAAEWNRVAVVNWPEYSYCPEVLFRIARTDSEFLLHYRVDERYLRAVAHTDGGGVWEDSCVEWFVMPSDDGLYYNFEFNCAGTCLLAVGTGRQERQPAAPEVMAAIRRWPSLGRAFSADGVAGKPWELAVAIPFSCLFRHSGLKLEGRSLRGNFYKCGDKLPEPHFLSWRPIQTNTPDFHRPEFFGEMTMA